MRVLVGPLAELRHQGLASAVAKRLAGPQGTVVYLPKTGVSDITRLASAAEVVRLREALLGSSVEDALLSGGWRKDVVGYVCAGSQLPEPVGAMACGGTILVAVSDHADLTWRSPLTGPNDERLGPRFPSMTGVYVPEVITERSEGTGETSRLQVAGEGMIVVPGIVAGVRDDRSLSDHEAGMAAVLGCAGASSELAPVTVVAAHLGLRVAAAVLMRFD